MPTRFDFISPGIQLNEVDESQLPAVVSDELGPVIIGRSLSGPAMKPIRVRSIDDFNKIFGKGISGKGSQDNDIWRNGNSLGPTYGVYAAQAHLASQTTPVTFVRLLGEANVAADSNDELAGWSVDNSANPSAIPSTNASAYGLFVFPATGSGTQATGSLAAVFYVSGAALALKGRRTSHPGDVVTSSAGTLINSQAGAVGKFQMELYTADDFATVAEEFTFDFTPGSRQYIRDVFSTNPQLLQANKNFGLTNKNYFLGETYEVAVNSKLGTATTAGSSYGILLALDSGSLNFADHKKDMLPAKTGWFFNRKSQAYQDPEKLFRLVALHEGEWLQNNYCVRIKDLVLGNTLVPNSTFTIEVVDKNGTVVEQFSGLNLDPSSENYISKIIGDQYLVWDATNLKYNVRGEYLNNSNYVYVEVAEAVKNQQLQDRHALPVGFYGPLQPKPFVLMHESKGVQALHDALVYAGTKSTVNITYSGGMSVGDKLTLTHPDLGAFEIQFLASPGTGTETVFRDLGAAASPRFVATIDINTKNNNTSTAAAVAVLLNSITDYEATDDGAGVVTLTAADPLPKLTINLSETDAGGRQVIGTVTDGVDSNDFAHSFVVGNNSIPAHGGDANVFASIPSGFTGSVIFPSLRLTDNNSNSNGRNYPARSVFGVRHHRGTATRRDDSYIDLVRVLPSNASNTLTHHLGENESLPNSLQYSFQFSLDDIRQDSTNTSTYYYESGSYDATSAGDQSYSRKEGLSALLDLKVKQFEAPLFGGHDGLDLTEVEPFSNKNLTDKSRLSSYAYNSVFKALETLSDKETVEYDLLTIPGVTQTDVTDKILSIAADRQDFLAIIDVEGGYKPAYENNGSVTTGDINGTVTALDGRLINNSYAATYYPWVRLRDRIGGQNDVLYAPPSVAAVGALAKSQGASELWFAPAGFNRGGINELGGPEGPIITGTWEHLTKDDRDKLYSSNINPIARFPSLDQIVIFGQKTLQQTPSALDRINVRRLMIFLKHRIGLISNTILFDQNVRTTWSRFKFQADGVLRDVQSRLGVTEYRLVLDDKTTTADYVDRNILYAKIFIKPARAIEFIAVDFVITRSGIEF